MIYFIEKDLCGQGVTHVDKRPCSTAEQMPWAHKASLFSRKRSPVPHSTHLLQHVLGFMQQLLARAVPGVPKKVRIHPVATVATVVPAHSPALGKLRLSRPLSC